MPPEAKPHSGQDSFAAVLHSEIIAGSENLAAWIRQVQEQGAIESLFRMETWLKGIRAFFRTEHVPLSPAEKGEIVTRTFSGELGVVRQSIVCCEACVCDLLGLGVGGEFKFEEFLETQMRKDRMADFHVSQLAEQLTPRDSVSQLLESLNDFRVILDAYGEASRRDYQLYLSLGRTFHREIRNCRYIDMLIRQRFRLQYDLVENRDLEAVLRSIPLEGVRRNVTLALLYLFRFLKYLEMVATDLKRDRPLKHHLVLFALLHEEMGILSDFLKARFLKNRDAADSLNSAAEMVAYSIKTEAQRVLDRELLYLAREPDPVPIYARIENSHGLLLSCCESGILTLIRSIDRSFDASVLFPSRADSLVSAEKLRQDLGDLRQWLAEESGSKSELDPSKIQERLIIFRESSLRYLMYRDWEKFDIFSDTVAVTTNFIELRLQMRTFVDYLDLLIQEVSKRSVFRDKAPQI